MRCGGDGSGAGGDTEGVIAVVQSLSHIQLFESPWTVAGQDSPSFAISQSLLKFMSIEAVMPSNHLILCCLQHSILPNTTGRVVVTISG